MAAWERFEPIADDQPPRWLRCQLSARQGLMVRAVDPQIGVSQFRVEQQAATRRVAVGRLVMVTGEATAIDRDDAGLLESSNLA